jgi:hypothetical protein
MATPSAPSRFFFAEEAISAAGSSLPYINLEVLVDDTRKALPSQTLNLTASLPGSQPASFIPNPNYQLGPDLDATTARTRSTREQEMDLDAPTARVQGARASEESAAAGAEVEDGPAAEAEAPAEAAATPSPPVSLLAGYAADTVAGEDELGITADVESLCSVLMATQVQPPLSVGLFGDWGAGVRRLHPPGQARWR